MATRKEQKEQLRKERIEAERRSQAEARKKLMLGYIVAGLLAAAIVAGVVVAILSGGGGGSGTNGFPASNGTVPPDAVFDDREGTTPPAIQTANLEDAAKAAKCDLQLDLPDEGNEHFGDPAKVPDYGTNPPTSGPHYASPNPTDPGSGALAEGPYANTPQIARAVHALEHGRIEIQYSPDLPEQDQLALKGIYDADPRGVILFPNPDMPYEVATTAWQQLLGCKTYEGDATLDAIRDFILQYRGRGPEPIPF